MEENSSIAKKDDEEIAEISTSVEDSSQEETSDVKSVDNNQNQPVYFEIVIHNLPKHKSSKELKRFLLSLDLNPKKVLVHGQHAYATFLEEPEASTAVQKLNNCSWKGKILRVKRSEKHSKNVKNEPSGDQNSPINDECKDWAAAVIRSSIPLAHEPYEKQLQIKQSDSYKLLKKLSWQIRPVCDTKPEAGCQHFGVLETIRPSPVIDGYRNKCEFTIGKGPDGLPEVGFLVNRFREGGAVVIPADHCRHVPDAVKKVLAHFHQFLRQSEKTWPVFDVQSKQGLWRMLTARFFKLDFLLIFTINPRAVNGPEEMQAVKKALVDLFFNPEDETPNFYRVTSLYLSAVENQSDDPNYERLAGTPYAYESILGCRFRISPGTFFQTNSAGCQILYGVLVDYLKSIAEKPEVEGEPKKPARTLLYDVCCGAGTIAVALSRWAQRVIGIELSESAVHDARVNAACNERQNCEFLRGRAEDVFQEIQRNSLVNFSDFDKVVAVLDPPRKGLGDKIISCLRQCSPITTVIYVSCDPAGATKNFVDLCRRTSKRYSGLPFELKRVVPVDMFPHTGHFEWVLFFERDKLIV